MDTDTEHDPATDANNEPSKLVKSWRDKIRSAKSHFEKDFTRMKNDQDFAYFCAPKSWYDSGSYVVPILRRQLKQITAGLYARDPVAIAKRRTRIDSVIWNGDLSVLESAGQTLLGAMQGAAMDQEIIAFAQQIMAEAEQTRSQLALRDRFAKTLEILFEYYIGEMEPRFKRQMKSLINREMVNGVGYAKLDFQRILEPRTDVEARITDDATRLAEIERLIAEQGDDRNGEDLGSQAESLRIALAELEARPAEVLREGPVIGFPDSDKIIVDPACKYLDGFVGARWIAHEMDMTPAEIKRTYRVDIDDHSGDGGDNESANLFHKEDLDRRTVCVWEVEDKALDRVFTISECYNKFIKAPDTPRIRLERFWSVFPFITTPVEHRERIYPLSFVHLMRDTQNEYNIARQGLKDHRRANKPLYGMKQGALSPDEKQKLAHHDANEVLEIRSTVQGDKINDIVSAFEPYMIDPNQYATNHVMDDVQRAGGLQESNIGGLSGATATEATIGESSRESGQSSDVDDLDDFLSELAKGMSEIMLSELSIDTVKEIAGAGAVWPDLSDSDIFKGVALKTRAGSSGRPNGAVTLSKLERAMPFLMQIPNVSPRPLATRYAEALDLDPAELVIEGLPSIAALNKAAGAMPAAAPSGAGGDDPASQGPEGARNEPAPPATSPAAAAMFPAGMAANA